MWCQFGYFPLPELPISLAQPSYTVLEEGGSVMVCAVLVGDTENEVAITLFTQDESASSIGGDFLYGCLIIPRL